MRRPIVATAAIVLVAGALAGCREEEQGRALIYQKGEYAGRADTTLSKAQLDELSDRAALQGRTGSSTSAGGPATVDQGPREVKETATEKVQGNSEPLPEAALNDRLKLQSGK